MQKTREVAPGFLLAVVFILIILGSAALSLVESTVPQTAVPPTQPPTNIPTLLPTNTLIILPSPTAVIVLVTETALPPATDTETPPPPPPNCQPPNNWMPIIVQANDTLYSLAFTYNITPDTLAEQNCLLTADLAPGSTIYVPRVATVVPTACRPPSNWAIYRVQPGDNLYRISLKYRTTVAKLQQGNCMGSSELIYAGQKLYVPNVATSTPIPSATPLPSDTPPPPTDTTAPSETPTSALTP